MTQTPASAEAVLRSGLAALAFPEAPRIAEQLMIFGGLLLEANQRTNLMGSVDMDKLVVHHFLDSLAPFSSHRFRPPLVDLGSGAGLPGIPVAIAFPRAPIELIEPRRLRADFLQSAIAAMGLENVEVVRTAAESAGRSAARREKSGTVLMRAIGKPAVALELGLPLLKHDGKLWLYRGREAEPTKEMLDIAALLGGSLLSADRVEVPHLDAERHLWVFRKVAPTPEGYPRRSGVPDRVTIQAGK
jgi:16S rRNA (guanine527-N7)-methyltransferase